MTAAPQSSPRRAGSLVRSSLLLLALPFAPALLTGWLHPRAPDWTAIRAEAVAPAPHSRDLAALRSAPEFANALWLDARPATDFAAGHVPGALSLSEDDWETGFAELVGRWDGEQSLVVYCGGESCHASEAVARRLRRELGVENVFVLEGGWDAWRSSGGTVEEGSAP